MFGSVVLYDAECESVSHVLWECPAYQSAFMLELSSELGEYVGLNISVSRSFC